MITFLRNLFSNLAYKNSTVPPDAQSIPHLPSEYWEQIFARLPRGQLLQLRRTCRYWRNIIDSCPAFRDRFHVKFPQDAAIAPSSMPPAANVTVEFPNFAVISDVGSALVGEVVTRLVLGRCEVPIEMLRQTPNLKSLHLFYVKMAGSEVVDFELNRLECLTLEYVSSAVLDILGRIIPRLKIFKYNGAVMDSSEEADEERTVLKFVAEQLDVMEKRLPKWDISVQENWYSLKRATLNPHLFGETRFLGVPQVVRHARVEPTNEELGAFRELRNVSESELMAFVGKFAELKELTFVNCEAVRDVCVEKLSRVLTDLEKLTLHNCATTDVSAQHIIQNCVALKHLEVHERWNLDKFQFEYFITKLNVFEFERKIE